MGLWAYSQILLKLLLTPINMKDPKQVKKGKKSKAAGGRFELKVRKDLESKGQTVCKWSNNVEFKEENSEEVSSIDYNGKWIHGKMVIAKGKFNPFSKAVMVGQGFPDFIAYKPTNNYRGTHKQLYEVIGVESKMNGILSKLEKQKCSWYLKNKKFSEIWIAQKGEKRGEIKYVEFK